MVATYNNAGDTYEDTDFQYEGLDPARPLSVLIGTSAAAADLTGDIPLESVVATDNGTTGRSLISLTIQQPLSALPTVKDQAVVKIVDHALNTETHRAFIRSRRPITGLEASVEIIADDIGGLLDDKFIVLEVRPAETMLARITALWFFYRPNFLDNDLSFVSSIGGTLPAQTFAGVMLREAIEMTIAQASSTASYHVDSVGRLHVYTSESNPAPYSVIFGTPGGGQIAPEDLSIDYDSNTYFNRVYVQGANPDGSGWFQDDAAIATVGGLIRETVIQAADCETAAMALALAQMFLADASSSIPRGMFTASSPYDGWRSSQNLTVTEADIGLSAVSFPIRSVTMTFEATRTGFRRIYVVEFGGRQAGGLGARSETLGSGQLVYGNLGGQSNVYITSDGVTVTDGL